jgi:hypothetical protein
LRGFCRDRATVRTCRRSAGKKLPLLVGNLAQVAWGQDTAELVLFDDQTARCRAPTLQARLIRIL